MKSPNMKAEKIGKSKLRLNIYDQIGPSWLGMIDGKSVADALGAAGEVKQIDVHINSPGGSVFEGVAIYNILKEHPAKIRMKVDGVAASSASVVLMAGDEIEVPRNAPVMIHNPMTIAAGGQSEMQKTADFLGKVKDSIVQTYAERTKKSPEELAAMMDEETWMYGDDAVKNGFADRVVGDLKIAPVAAPSNFTMPFKNAPDNFFSLVALASGITKTEVQKMSDANDDKAALELKAKQEAEAKAAAEAQAKLEVEAKARQEAEMKAAVEAATKRAADITAACNKARKPELAVKFIAENKSLADVNALLLDQLCASNAPGDDGGSVNMNKDENAAYKAEYASNKAEYESAGISEADFVSMRRIDDGKETLQAAAK